LHELLSLIIGAILALTGTPPEALGLRVADRLVMACAAPQTCATAHALRARVHAHNFDYAAALVDVDQALMYRPDAGVLHLQRGQVNLLLYEWDRALEDYNRALEYSPNSEEIYYYRGLLYYTWLRRDEAQRDFERVLLLAPRSGKAAEVRRYLQAIAAERSALAD
jgi:tetratricopeptide (TPR) repeat protein